MQLSAQGLARPGDGSLATDALLASAARAGRPLFVEVGRYGEASAIGAATAALGVPVILVGTNYENAVDVLAAARRYDHLHLETSRMAYLGALEIAVSQVGAGRVLLGTGSPLRAVQSSLNAIALARISDDAKRAILAGNAARLFGLPAVPIQLPEVWLPERTVDVHAHSGWTPVDIIELSDEELMAELARQNNTRYAIASSIAAIDVDSEAVERVAVSIDARENEQGEENGFHQMCPSASTMTRRDAFSAGTIDESVAVTSEIRNAVTSVGVCSMTRRA